MWRTTLCDHLSSPRREWGLAPLCGAVATFSGYSKDPSRPWRRRCYSERHRGGDYLPSLHSAPFAAQKDTSGAADRRINSNVHFAHGSAKVKLFFVTRVLSRKIFVSLAARNRK